MRPGYSFVATFVVIGGTAKAYFGNKSNVDPVTNLLFAVITSPTITLWCLVRVVSLVPLVIAESLASKVELALNVVPSSVVPNLRPKVASNSPSRIDASSGEKPNCASVNGCTLAETVFVIAISPKTIQPAGCTEDFNWSRHDEIDSPTLITYEKSW